MKIRPLLCAAALALLAGCSHVDVTKTAKGWHQPTNPNEIEIVKTRPARPFVELGDVTATKFNPSDVAKMHNALRNKAAPLGANAVLLTSEGIDRGYRFAMGVALAWTDAKPK
jgi:hypothetical protein